MVFCRQKSAFSLLQRIGRKKESQAKLFLMVVYHIENREEDQVFGAFFTRLFYIPSYLKRKY
jgi:hypothetical protein